MAKETETRAEATVIYDQAFNDVLKGIPSVTIRRAVVARIADALAARDQEIARLKAGQFTADEFQNLCHSRTVQDGFDVFTQGCDAYQRQLFGRCKGEG